MVSDIELVQKARDARDAHNAMIARIKAVIDFLRSSPPPVSADPASAAARQEVADVLSDIVATSVVVEPAPAP